MSPRLKSSKKWTKFPTEYKKQIEEVFTQSFSEYLKNFKLIVEGRIYSGEILLRVGIVEIGLIKQANFEVSIDYSTKGNEPVERIHNCIDAAASMMGEYFESDGEVDFPLEWKEYDFDHQKLFLQFSSVNTELEDKANALLGENFDSLIVEEEPEDLDPKIISKKLH